MKIPKDCYILLSVINTKLRDEKIDLEELCKKENIDIKDIENRLNEIQYTYDKLQNQFKN